MNAKKPRRANVRRMWAAYVAYDGARDGCIGQLFSKKTIPDDFGGLVPTTPVFVLPADPESVEGYAEAMRLQIEKDRELPVNGEHKPFEWMARAALTALLGTWPKHKNA